MRSNAHLALAGLALVVVIVAVDVLIFKGHFWGRLFANLGLVLIFAAVYLRFLRQP